MFCFFFSCGNINICEKCIYTVIIKKKKTEQEVWQPQFALNVFHFSSDHPTHGQDP